MALSKQELEQLLTQSAENINQANKVARNWDKVRGLQESDYRPALDTSVVAGLPVQGQTNGGNKP